MEDYYKQLKLCCGEYPRYYYTNNNRVYLVCLTCGKESKPQVDNITAGIQWNKEMKDGRQDL